MVRRWLSENRLLLAFILLSISSGIAAGVMQLVFPLYALSLAISDGSIGLLRGIGQFGGLLTTLPGGFLVDRFGSRRIYIVSGLLNVLAVCLIPTASSYYLLMIILLVEGGIGSIRWTALNTAFFERLNSIGVSRAGWMRAAMAIGLNFLGPLLGGRVTESFSFQTSYLLIGMVLLAPICLMLAFTPKPRQALLHLGGGKPVPLLAQLRPLLGNRQLMHAALNQSLSMSCFNAFSVFIILFLVKTLHFSAPLASLIVAVQGVAFVLIMLCSGGLLGRFSMSALYAACYLLQIAGLCVVGYAESLWLICAGSVSLGLGVGLMTTMSYSLLGKMAGKKGAVTGVFYLITGTGIALGPVLAGFLVSLFGVRAAFTGFLPLEGCALGYYLLILARGRLAGRYRVQADSERIQVIEAIIKHND